MSGTEQKPRVHWVSPLPPAQTDIAHYTNRVLPELTNTCDLVLWTDASSWDKSLELHCEVRRLDPDLARPRDFANAGKGQGVDAVFVQIGNSWVFHAGFLRFIRRIPSVIVLHDLAIQELCFDAMHNKLFSRDVYEEEMLRWHGEAGVKKIAEVFKGSKKPFDLSQDIPGFEITLDRAISVVSHTPAAFEAVNATGSVPSYLIDLPFQPSASAASAERAENGPLKFVQFGYIGPNRRLMEVLTVLGSLNSEIDFRFDIMGKVWNTSLVEKHIHKLGIQDKVRIHGFIPESQLDRCLAEAHLVFNLRYPTMGEASGSQLRIWNARAASVVTDLGWYSTLPDNTVFKVPLQDEADALRFIIRRLNANRSVGKNVGALGRARLEDKHTPSKYAGAIAQIAEQVSRDAHASILASRARSLLAQNDVGREIFSQRLAKCLG